MWSLLMMVFTGVVLANALYFNGNVNQGVVQSQQAGDLQTLLEHRRVVMNYVYNCRPSAQAVNTTVCPVAVTVEGNPIDSTDLLSAGLTGASSRWQSYWGGDTADKDTGALGGRLYFYPADLSPQSGLLAQLQSQSNASVLVGLLERLAASPPRLAAPAPSAHKSTLPSFFNGTGLPGMMLWVVPLPIAPS